MGAKFPQKPPKGVVKPTPSPPPPPPREIGVAVERVPQVVTITLPITLEAGWQYPATVQLWMAMQVKRHRGDVGVGEVIGVFSTKELAEAACRKKTDCVAPITLDAVAPRETTVMPGAYYPLAGAKP